jgi:hypothetical protein
VADITPTEHTADPDWVAFSGWFWLFSSLFGSFVAFDGIHLPYNGPPGHSRIQARIFDLRQDGYEIRTQTRPTAWRLIAKPAPKQLTWTSSRTK